jgi:hypothetical protein
VDEHEWEKDIQPLAKDMMSDVSEESASDDEDGNDPILAENVQICLPSSFGKQVCARVGWGNMALQEMELRKGQANDLLEKIRLALGHKALLYRTRVRKSKGQKTKTRTWGAVRQADQILNECVRGYLRARVAMVKLGADEEILSHYQDIGRKDLRLSGDVVEENRFGQKSDALPWFWRMGEQNKDQRDNWMSECECCHS